jgi:hypothetical protein
VAQSTDTDKIQLHPLEPGHEGDAPSPQPQDAIEYGDCDFQEDCMARKVLILSVPPEMVPRWLRRSRLQKHGMPSR